MHFIFVNVMGVGSLTGDAAEDIEKSCAVVSLCPSLHVLYVLVSSIWNANYPIDNTITSDLNFYILKYRHLFNIEKTGIFDPFL